jgi:hypothetical protein
VGILGQCYLKHVVEECTVWAMVAQRGWGRVEMSADDNSWIGVWEQLQAGQEVVGGGSEGVLVSSPVQLFTHELFGRGVGNGAHGHVGRGDAAAVIE